jgi:hypothetical protein
MIRVATIAALFGALALPLLADTRMQKVEVDSTDAAPVSANGTVRIEGGLGDLMIEPWDGKEVRVSAARIRYADDEDKAEIEKELQAITVTVKQENGATVVTTHFPHRNFWIKLFDGKTGANMEYRIQVPRGTNVAVEHGNGEVTLLDTGGNIDIKAGHGDIVAMLSQTDGNGVDAHTSMGGVDSDLGGNPRHKHIVGEDYRAKGNTARTVKLRLKCGGITIQKAVEFKYS